MQIKQFIKIGSPGYQVTKVKDPITGQLGLLFQVHYPKIASNVRPRHRFMSSFEQSVEAASREHQYLVVGTIQPGAAAQSARMALTRFQTAGC